MLSFSRLIPLFLVALAIHLFFGASAAKAACTDYVVVSNPSQDAVANGRAAPMQHSMPDGHKPCNGPQCRGQAPLPVAPLTTVTAQTNDAVVVVVNCTSISPLAGARSVLEQWALESEDHSLLADPPPRFGFHSVL